MVQYTIVQIIFQTLILYKQCRTYFTNLNSLPTLDDDTLSMNFKLIFLLTTNNDGSLNYEKYCCFRTHSDRQQLNTIFHY